MSSEKQPLPHLLYAGDVAVQNFVHGSSLLYRLLKEWPAEKLLVVETSWIPSEESRRIPGVRYVHHRPWWTRMFFSPRLAAFAPLMAALAARSWGGLAKVCGDFPASALLTVAHGFNWLGASELARRKNIPLHLIVHDDWARPGGMEGRAMKKLDVIFAEHYRRAASRLCVSPGMEEACRGRYDVPGTVLYPARDPSIEPASVPQPQVSQPVKQLRVAFAGTIHPGYEKPLGSLVRALEPIDGKLLMFGPFDHADLSRHGVAGSRVECRGLLDARALQQALQRDADVLYVPMSFEKNDRANTEASFPSKLADYSACGLPILVHTPAWSSAARWAREFASGALVVDSPDEASLLPALSTLQNDQHTRVRLATEALATGAKFFSAASARQTFVRCILSA